MKSAAALADIATGPLVTVVIPSLNEAASLPATLAALHSALVPCEVILVDGGSSDDSVAIASAAGARVITSPRQQRAYQLNLGAREARGDILLFLHADTILPEGGLDAIGRALADAGTTGGAFARRYHSRSVLLHVTCLLAALRNRLIGWHLGDQAIFVRRAIFHYLGGFQEVDWFEDVDFSRRMGRFGRLVTLSPAVVSSARRFSRAGPAYTTLRDFAWTMSYLIRGLPRATEEPARISRRLVYGAIKNGGHL